MANTAKAKTRSSRSAQGQKRAAGLGAARRRIQSAAQGGIDALARLRDDAQKALQRNRLDVEKAIDSLRKDIASRADRALRDVERRILRQLNAASAEQMRELERRVARLEKALKQPQGSRGASAAA